MRARSLGLQSRSRIAALGCRCVVFSCGAVLLLLTLPAAEALAQPDPFRPTAPRAARQARPPPGETQGVARQTQPPFAPPAGYAWAIDRRSSCHVMLPVHLAIGVVRWTGQCLGGMASGNGTLTVNVNGAVEQCSGNMGSGIFRSRERCPNPAL